ncbi:hypothetical protein FM038_005080 [Shewanella eurypsychrophilus]|uniref:Uncharacterized protein n=1 Tax=Shewanella eurypsychrophilus TaxID=2593656 RepID=A0ABX6V2R9_9GAMM|nr:MULTISPECIES: hypothetical protein [Shewanella]QFU21583.1 hypothetical protein FS418_06660 [Shewanella sp. YLB-09]QPG56873.1 hypothetical protein FM038_005080 [Shewanella eurypsychrophilus]
MKKQYVCSPSPQFKALSKEEEAQQIWKILTLPESIVKVKVATYLRRPALEALTPELQNLDVFQPTTDKKRRDQYKQMCGNFMSKIMEIEGYKIKQKGVKLAYIEDKELIKNPIFVTATRFTLKGEK